LKKIDLKNIWLVEFRYIFDKNYGCGLKKIDLKNIWLVEFRYIFDKNYG